MAGAFGREWDRLEVQRELLALLRESLQADGISMSDDFVGCGGASLTAVRLNGRIRELFGLEFPLNLWFDAHSFGELAEKIYATLAVEKPFGFKVD